MFPNMMELSRKLMFHGACVAMLAACGPAPVDGPYTASGELLALSGGDAGPEAACHTCHGLKGEGDGDLVPRLAALDRGYLVRQLIFFDKGQRHHAQMHWIAKHLDPAEQDRIAEYYARMKWDPVPRPFATACDSMAARIYHSGDPERGLASCASCHGPSGEGVGRGNPAIAGQPARYLATQLRKWRSGERYGDALGEMRAAARMLADEEIGPLAVYTASLSGSPDDPESPAICLPPRRPD